METAIETLKAIARQKILTTEEQQALLNTIRTGDATAIPALVESWEAIILTIAAPYQNRGLSLEDMITIGKKELTKLAMQEVGNTGREGFTRFGAWCVKQGILKGIDGN